MTTPNMEIQAEERRKALFKRCKNLGDAAREALLKDIAERRMTVGTKGCGKKMKELEKRASLAIRDVLVEALKKEKWCLASKYGKVLKLMVGEE